MRFRSSLFEIPCDDPFEHDLLDRKDQIGGLTRLVESVEGPCVLAVDGAWGAGKTVFLRLWARVLRDKGFRVVQFNAWEADFSDDPLMALYSQLEATLPKSADDTMLFDAGARMISQIASTVLRTDVMAAIEKSQAKTKKLARKRLDRYRETQEAIDDFKEALTNTAESGKLVVVCVDELDRCRPDYAIRFLEATKHIFDVEGVIFLLAVNLSEMANSVRALYGAGFDGHHYLTRFVDQVFHLQTNRSFYLKHLLELTGLTNLKEPPYRYSSLEEYLVTYVVGSARITLRDLEQGIHRLGMVISSLDPKKRALHHAIVMMIFRIVVPDTYRRFIRGEISDLEALKALNRRIDRPDDWWKTTSHSSHWTIHSHLERTLIKWYRHVKETNRSATPLLDLRKSEAPKDDKKRNHASEVASNFTWTDLSAIGHAHAIVEMITYDPQETPEANQGPEPS